MARHTPDKRVGKARQGTHPKAPAPSLHIRGGERLKGGGVTIYNPVKSGQAAQKIIRDAARRKDRIEVVVTLKDGRRVELMTNPNRKGERGPGSQGMSARGLVQQKVNKERGNNTVKIYNSNWIGNTAASLKGRLAGMAAVANGGNRYDKGPRAQFGVDDIDSMQINVYHRT